MAILCVGSADLLSDALMTKLVGACLKPKKNQGLIRSLEIEGSLLIGWETSGGISDESHRLLEGPLSSGSRANGRGLRRLLQRPGCGVGIGQGERYPSAHTGWREI